MNEKTDNPFKNSKFHRSSEPLCSIYFNHVNYNDVLLLRTRNSRSVTGNCIVEISVRAMFLRLWSLLIVLT